MGGGPCAYWNYYYRDPGGEGWIYSPLGAALRKAGPGSVEAWVWGDGHSPPSDDLTFESICVAPTPAAPTPEPAQPTSAPRSAEQAAQPTSSPTPAPPKATPVPAATSSATPFSAASPTETARPTASPTSLPATSSGSGISTYWPFGLAVVGLVLIGLLTRFRRSR